MRTPWLMLFAIVLGSVAGPAVAAAEPSPVSATATAEANAGPETAPTADAADPVDDADAADPADARLAEPSTTEVETPTAEQPAIGADAAVQEQAADGTGASTAQQPPGATPASAPTPAEAAATSATQSDTPVAPPDATATPAPAAPASAAVTPAPAAPTASDLAGYLAAVETHLRGDPALAAAYTVFWSELRSMAQAGKLIADLTPETIAAIGATGKSVASAVREHFRDAPPSYAAREALRIAVLTLARDQQAKASGKSGAERLLANLDQAVAPLVKVDGRYEYAGNLQRPADLGFGAEVWLLCRQSAACKEAHDELFASAMAGTTLTAPVEQRISRDPLLAAAPQLPALLAAAGELDARLAAARAGGGARAAREVAGLAAREYWRSIAAGVSLPPGIAPSSTPAPATPPGETAGAGLPPDVNALDALFTLGRAGAYLAGQETLANVFAVTRTPVLDFATTIAQGALVGTLGPSVAGIGLLFAGVQALALFDDLSPGDGGDTMAPAELRQLVVDLNDSTYRSLQSARAEQVLATNTVDTRVAALGIALDVVKTDVARLETAARRRVGSEFHSAEARRWTAFDEDNERCFSLRNRDPKTQRLRPAEFRRCEDRFLQGATRRSQYATRGTEYVLDARFIEPGDPQFPFHDHYPLLATLGGLETRAALALPDPLDWQQHAAALMRLYQENPARRGDAHKRLETLESVQAAGTRTRQALLGITLRETPDRTVRFRQDLHRRALDDYFTALDRLILRVGALDDPDAHPYGKRLTEGLEQPLPEGLKRSAIEATIGDAAAGGNRIGACRDAPASAFEPQADRLVAESRRFFGDPIQPAELVAAWNRDVVDAMNLQPANFTELVPGPYLWAALEGMGKLEFCLAQFRPEAVAFTRDRGPLEDTLLGRTLVGAELEVRFRADPAIAATIGLAADKPTVVARYSADRACAFGYRNDQEGCSRASCLTQLAPLIWSDDSRITGQAAYCEREPIKVQLPRRGAVAGVDALVAKLDDVFRTRQQARLARLEADVLRSSEYEMAAARYLEYYALAGVTLGTYPDGADSLGGLFSSSNPLAPRSVVQALLTDHRDVASLRDHLATRAEQTRSAVNARGQQLETAGLTPGFPHFRALDETLARLDLATAAYSVD